MRGIMDQERYESLLAILHAAIDLGRRGELCQEREAKLFAALDQIRLLEAEL